MIITNLIINLCETSYHLYKLWIAILLHVHAFKWMLLNICIRSQTSATSAIKLFTLLLTRLINIVHLLILLLWFLWSTWLDHFRRTITTRVYEWIWFSNFGLTRLICHILSTTHLAKIWKIISELILLLQRWWSSHIWERIICLKTGESEIVLIWIILDLLAWIVVFWWLFCSSSETIYKPY